MIEDKLGLYSEFLGRGLMVMPVENNDSYALFLSLLCEVLDCDNLDKLHEKIGIESVNAIRMSAFRSLNKISAWKNQYFSLASSTLSELLGPDILIQRKLNLSIQMPGDDTSILGMHADTFSGQSPFEIVVWTPFSNFEREAGMYYFDLDTSYEMYRRLPEFELIGLESMREEFWPKANFIEIEMGQVAIFTGCIFHGNLLNSTPTTRISANCRFKSVYTPESMIGSAERAAGVFYELLQESPVSRIGRKVLSMEVKF